MMQVVQMSVGGHVTDRFNVAEAAKGGCRAPMVGEGGDGGATGLQWGCHGGALRGCDLVVDEGTLDELTQVYRACWPCGRVGGGAWRGANVPSPQAWRSRAKCR